MTFAADEVTGEQRDRFTALYLKARRGIALTRQLG
jgi:hypothetical protein